MLFRNSAQLIMYSFLRYKSPEDDNCNMYNKGQNAKDFGKNVISILYYMNEILSLTIYVLVLVILLLVN